MNFKGRAASIFMAAAAVMVGLLFVSQGTSAKTSAGSKRPPVYIIDLMAQAEQHPEAIFFSANSGSRVMKIKWNGWGKGRTVGRGWYSVSGPSIPGHPYPKGHARIVAWQPAKCVPGFGSHKGKSILVYKHARLLRPVEGGGRKWIDISGYTGYGICK